MDTEKILLSIGVDETQISAAIKSIQEARVKIDDLKKSQAELKKAGEGNSQQFILQERELKKLNGVVSENSKILDANTDMVRANEESIEALAKANKDLIKERNGLSTATESGRKRIVEINAQIDKNTNTIKQNVSAIEKQKINIGNYSSALSGISPQLGGFAQQLGASTEASGGLGKGIMGMVRASLAFIATPIGAIIAALVLAFKALQTFITGSTGGMDKFEKISAAASAVIGVLVDRVVAFVGSVVKLLSGDIQGGLRDMKDSFSGIGENIANDARLAYELAGALQELEDREIEYGIAAAENENVIKRLLLQSRNRTLSEKERIDLLEEALAIEIKDNEQLVKIKEEALRISNEQATASYAVGKALEASGGAARKAGESETEYAKRILATGEVLDDQRDQLVELIKSRENAEGQSLAIQEKIQNQRDAIEEKAEAQRQKRIEKEEADRKKREEEILKSAQNEAEAIRKLTEFRLQQEAIAAKSIEDRVLKEIELEEFKRSELLKKEKITAGEIELINAQSETAITNLKAKGLKDREALEKENAAKTQANLERDLQMLVKQAQDEMQIEINKQKERLLIGEISQQEYNEALQALQLAALEAEQGIKEVFGQEDLALSGRITDAKIQQKQYEAETSRQLEAQKLQDVTNVFGQTAALFNQQTGAYKLLASGQAIMNTYAAAAAALAPPPVGAGPILGPIFAALAIARGIASVAKINSVSVPKLADGGMIPISGKDHSQGGENVHVGGKLVANVQGGEDLVVLKRGASPLLRTLSTANKLAGGKDFYTNRAPQRYLADGGFVSRTATQQINNIVDPKLMASVFREAAESIPAPILQVTELDRVQNNRAKSATISELQ